MLLGRLILLSIIGVGINVDVYSQQFPEFWERISNASAFPPQDSSPNGCVVHNGRVYIMGGYIHESGDNWYSKADLWSSEDGVHWEQIDDSPPYSPYSAFISHHGKLWAFGDISFMSDDGIHWDTLHVSIPLELNMRATVHNDEIWLLGERLYKSIDGEHWEVVNTENSWNSPRRWWPGFVSFNDRLWLFGGGIGYLSGQDFYYNDVWSSEDGIHWEQVASETEWSGRYWFGYQIFDNKIWLLGGWSNYETDNGYYGNKNDVWYTDDGLNWHPLLSSTIWQPRHANYSWVKDDALWVSSGYGGQGVSTLYNDVWKLNKLWEHEKLEPTIVLYDSSAMYGEPTPPTIQATSNIATLSVQNDSTMLLNSFSLLPAGSYYLTVATEETSIYKAAEKSFSYSIMKRDLIVKVKDQTIEFGEELPKFNIDYEGFIDGEDASVLLEMPHVSTTAFRFSPIGEYPIELTGGYSHNYNLIMKNATLKVESIGFDIVCYPNPASHNLCISAPSAFDNIYLFNLLGEMIIEKQVSTPSVCIELNGIPSGTYIIKTVLGNQRIYKRIKIVK